MRVLAGQDRSALALGIDPVDLALAARRHIEAALSIESQGPDVPLFGIEEHRALPGFVDGVDLAFGVGGREEPAIRADEQGLNLGLGRVIKGLGGSVLDLQDLAVVSGPRIQDALGVDRDRPYRGRAEVGAGGRGGCEREAARGIDGQAFDLAFQKIPHGGDSEELGLDREGGGREKGEKGKLSSAKSGEHEILVYRSIWRARTRAPLTE